MEDTKQDSIAGRLASVLYPETATATGSRIVPGHLATIILIA